MAGNILKLTDTINTRDVITIPFKPSVFNRTKIIGGYDYSVNEKGVSQLGEILFEEENQIVLGGALYTLEKIFGVQSSLPVEYLNNIMGVATDGAPIVDIYPKENVVCLFGVGIGGCGDTIGSVVDVKFYEREIFNMIPFRLTADALTVDEQLQYWFRKLDAGTGKTAYYLKTFEMSPVIKALWKDAVGDEDGTEVEPDVYNTIRTDPIESFVELILKISKNDVREYFEDIGTIEQTRINSIGLFTGVKGTLGDEISEDYKQVKLFSKLNINNEMLTLAKDLTIIYRIYTS